MSDDVDLAGVPGDGLDSRVWKPGAFLAAWLLSGSVLASQVFLWSILQGVAKPWWQCVVVSLPDMVIWAGLIPVAAGLSRRVPPRAAEWRRAVGVHVPAAIVTAGAAVLLHVAIARALGWVDPGGFDELLGLRLAVHLPTGMAIYAAVVVGAEALRARDERAGSTPGVTHAAGVGAPTGERSSPSGGRATPGRSRVAVPVDDGTRLLDADDIDWIEADRNYSVLHLGDGTERVREPLGSLEARLGLVRIHRSTLVNLGRVERVHRWRHGDLLVELVDGTRLRLSRSYRESFEERLGTRV